LRGVLEFGEKNLQALETEFDPWTIKGDEFVTFSDKIVLETSAAHSAGRARRAAVSSRRGFDNATGRHDRAARTSERMWAMLNDFPTQPFP